MMDTAPAVRPAPKQRNRGKRFLGLVFAFLAVSGLAGGVLALVRGSSSDPSSATTISSSLPGARSTSPITSPVVRPVPAVGTAAQITDGRVSFAIAGAPPRTAVDVPKELPGASAATYTVVDRGVVTGVMVMNVPQVTLDQSRIFADSIAAGFAKTAAQAPVTGTPLTVGYGSAYIYRWNGAATPVVATIVVVDGLAVAIVDSGATTPETLQSAQVLMTLMIDGHKILT